MATKHEQIIRHIISLKVGSKISVRQIARELNVSDGTAYRAIKEAENQGLVSTIERVGTIRIERKEKENFDRLSFAEVINIVDGQVLGGREGLHKTLNKFLIGAMKLDAMMEYTEANSLLIVGNRVKAHELAIKKGAAVLITGGFDTEEYIKRLADEKKLPIISTSHDTYTVAALINRAIYDQLIKKEIVFVKDILTPYEDIHTLRKTDKVEKWYELNRDTTHTRFPVIDDQRQVIGVVTAKDIIDVDKNMKIEQIMTKKPYVVQEKTTIAYVAHMMVWEGLDIIPVVNEDHVIQGLVTRVDLLKALHQLQRQPQVGETIDDVVAKNLQPMKDDHTVFRTKVTPQMTNQIGTLSDGVFLTLITEASSRYLYAKNKSNLVVENLTIYFIEPVQIDSQLIVKPNILELGKIYTKIEVELFNQSKLVGKGLIMAQLIDDHG